MAGGRRCICSGWGWTDRWWWWWLQKKNNDEGWLLLESGFVFPVSFSSRKGPTTTMDTIRSDTEGWRRRRDADGELLRSWGKCTGSKGRKFGLYHQTVKRAAIRILMAHFPGLCQCVRPGRFIGMAPSAVEGSMSEGVIVNRHLSIFILLLSTPEWDEKDHSCFFFSVSHSVSAHPQSHQRKK